MCVCDLWLDVKVKADGASPVFGLFNTTEEENLSDVTESSENAKVLL